jgi:alcohol dehydrogenase
VPLEGIIETDWLPMTFTMNWMFTVAGLGGVGLSALLGARLAGARQIIAVDLSAEKLAFARTLGATDTVDASAPDAVKQIRDLSAGGVEYFFEMAGSVKALEMA